MGYARVVELGLSVRSKWFLLAALALMLLVALTWNRLALAIGFASSETRPALLNDAEWGKPDTALAFRHRFGNGSSEAELVRWLAANHFEIDGGAHRASRTVHGLPCNEDVAVSWTATNGTIRESKAVVSEAGCL
jgi:hypothetical protein